MRKIVRTVYSRPVVGEDDYGKFRLERDNLIILAYLLKWHNSSTSLF